MSEFIDPAADLVLQMQRDALKELENEANPEPDETEEITESPYKKFITKIKPVWSKEDQNAIAQMRAAANEEIQEIFGNVLSTLDKLYLQIRQPRIRKGQVVRDDDGRVVWELDEYDNPVEDWEKLTAQDIEKVLLDLHKIKFVAAKQVNDLFLEALFARMSSKDVWYEAYQAVLQGTTGDREAVANRAYKDEKYQAFFRYSLFSSANVIMQELNALVRVLEKVMNAKLRSWT